MGGGGLRVSWPYWIGEFGTGCWACAAKVTWVGVGNSP